MNTDPYQVDRSPIDPLQMHKVITFSDCSRSMENCIAERRNRRIEDRDNLARELQNIHTAIARQNDDTEQLKASVAAMPSTIVKELRAMGVLK